MPTAGRPLFRARFASTTAALRPPVCGSETSAIVQPVRDAGQVPIPLDPTCAGAATVFLLWTVAKPPVAVTISALVPPRPPAAATAATPPATATTSPSNARLTQLRPGASTDPMAP